MREENESIEVREREMVLFPSEEQFSQKSGELMICECYWTIPFYPEKKEELIGSKIYFCDKIENYICLRATITSFGDVEGKKAVFFELKDDDYEFWLDLDELGYEHRKQTRGWGYRWFSLEEGVG